MTEDQILLFLHAIENVSVRKINDNVLAHARVSGDQEAGKVVTRALSEKENTLFKFLLDHEVD